jgi:Tfp pilus assembly protein PilO
MTLNERDKKILIVLAPLLIAAAYWFLLLAPKREEATAAKQEQVKQEKRRNAAEAAMNQASGAKTDFAADYGEIVRLGKAIPAQVDMPSLLVQLDHAAEGTGIRFTKITTGDRTTAGAATSTGTTTPPAAGTNTTPAGAGGAPAQSAPGAAAEGAGNAAATATDRNNAAAQSGVDATTSTTAREGGLPVGGAAGGTSAVTGGAAPAPAALETVPLQLEFVGDFFNLADFFHDVKRLVKVVNSNVVVNGRLVTIETVNFSSDPQLFPRIKAELGATVYLAPKAEGATAGATPQGPGATTTPASTGSTPAPAGATPAPTAVATP